MIACRECAQEVPDSGDLVCVDCLHALQARLTLLEAERAQLQAALVASERFRAADGASHIEDQIAAHAILKAAQADQATLRAEIAHLQQEHLYWAKAIALVSDMLASEPIETIDAKRDKMMAVLRNAAYRIGGDEALDGQPVPPESIHTICHNLHGTVDARGFADGCNAEQRRLYGCAPDADTLAHLQQEQK